MGKGSGFWQWVMGFGWWPGQRSGDRLGILGFEPKSSRLKLAIGFGLSVKGLRKAGLGMGLTIRV